MRFDNTKSLAESVVTRGLDLSESLRWRDYTVAIREGYKEKHGTSIPENIIATTATLLENTREYLSSMNETTRVVNMGNFIDYGFDVISATIPNLIAHEVLSVQPMNAKHSTIFYLQYLYGTTKSPVTKGDTMNSPFTGVPGSTFNYTDEVVDGEVVGTGDGSTTTFSVNLGFTPVKSGTAKLYLDGSLVAEYASTSNGVDTLSAVNSSGISATVTLGTGAVAVTASSAPTSGKVLTLGYSYDMDLTEVGFSQVDLDLGSISIEARPRKLRSRRKSAGTLINSVNCWKLLRVA